MMKYNEQAQRKIEALQNKIDLLHGQIKSKQISGEEALELLVQIKRLTNSLLELIDLEYA